MNAHPFLPILALAAAPGATPASMVLRVIGILFPLFALLFLGAALRRSGFLTEAFAEGGAGGEAKVAFEGGGVGVGRGDVTGLHRNEFLVGLEVVVLRQHAGPDQFLLQDGHEVQQVFGLAAADVVHGVGRHGQAVLPFLAGGGLPHHPIDAFYDIVHVGEVPAAVAVVVDLDSVAL